MKRMDTCRICGSASAEDAEADKISAENDRKIKKWQKEEGRAVKLLLLGTGESGKSTIIKQMKIIHKNSFNDEERRKKVQSIRKNVRDCILCIVGGMELLGIDLADASKQDSIEYLLKETNTDHFDYPSGFYDHVSRLWCDEGVQQCFRRSNEYQLLDCAKYFLDRIDTVRQEDYIPTDQDILRCRIMTNSIDKIEFMVKDGKAKVNFWVYDVGGQRGERRKWIQLFDNLTAILFILDCSSFDLVLREEPSKNRLLEAAEIFEQVWNGRFLSTVSLILFINKIDMLEEKINGGKSLNQLVDSMEERHKYYHLFQKFKDFTKPRDSERREFLEAFPRKQASDDVSPRKRSSRLNSLRTDISDEVVRTAVFIKRVFLEILDAPREDAEGRDWHHDHHYECFYTCAIDTENIQKVLNGCRSIIIKTHLNKYGMALGH